jgi:hypothetical protein
MQLLGCVGPEPDGHLLLAVPALATMGGATQNEVGGVKRCNASPVCANLCVGLCPQDTLLHGLRVTRGWMAGLNLIMVACTALYTVDLLRVAGALCSATSSLLTAGTSAAVSIYCLLRACGLPERGKSDVLLQHKYICFHFFTIATLFSDPHPNFF